METNNFLHILFILRTYIVHLNTNFGSLSNTYELTKFSHFLKTLLTANGTFWKQALHL